MMSKETRAFEGQREGEVVELVFRRHILTAWRGAAWLIFWVAIGAVPHLVWPEDERMWWVWLGAAVIGVLGAAYVYMLWYFSYYLLTSQRIRQVRQKGLFRKAVVDLGLDKIQSISYAVGMGGGLLGFGTLLLQTQVGDMRMGMVERPEKTYNKLQDLVNKV